MSEIWLVCDVGTGGIKASLLRVDGAILKEAFRAYPTQTGEGGIMEQNAGDWWDALVEAVHELNPSSLDAIALTGQMQDVILIDEMGNSLRPVILYSDTRARNEAAQVLEILGESTLIDITGNNQDAGGLLAKLLWLEKHEPTAIANSRHLLLGAADYIGFHMTGVATCDTTTASTTGLMKLDTRQPLDKALFEKLGIQGAVALLPSFTAGGAQLGVLGEDAASVLGVVAGIPVFHGPGDAGANTLGAGSGVEGVVYAYLGTSGWIAFTASHRATPDSGVITLAHPDPHLFIHIAPLMTAGGNLEWVRGLFGNADYGDVIAAAMQRPPTSLLYLPYLNGERAPFSDPLARGAFVGINPRTEPADLYRAVLEGVVYAYRHCLDALLSSPSEMLTMTGGGARSEQWCQLFADITGVPVILREEGQQVGVRGTLMAALVAKGTLNDFAPSDGFLPAAQTRNPNPRLREIYDRGYDLFRAVYPALQPIFADMPR